jgi:hypothetical protein
MHVTFGHVISPPVCTISSPDSTNNPMSPSASIPLRRFETAISKNSQCDLHHLRNHGDDMPVIFSVEQK